MASWSDGDGAGMCMRSYWPNVSVSAQVVGVSRRGARGSLGSGRSAGCAIGEGRTSPRLGAMAGIRSRPYPGRAPALAWLPRPPTTHVQSSRRVLTRSDRNKRVARGACRGVRVRARLRSLMAYAHVVMLRRGVPGLHSWSCRGITGLHSVSQGYLGGRQWPRGARPLRHGRRVQVRASPATAAGDE